MGTATGSRALDVHGANGTFRSPVHHSRKRPRSSWPTSSSFSVSSGPGEASVRNEAHSGTDTVSPGFAAVAG